MEIEKEDKRIKRRRHVHPCALIFTWLVEGGEEVMIDDYDGDIERKD